MLRFLNQKIKFKEIFLGRKTLKKKNQISDMESWKFINFSIAMCKKPTSCDGFLNYKMAYFTGKNYGAFEYGLKMQGNEIGK